MPNHSYKEPTRPIGTVAELFAGVGGFRIGLAKSGWKTLFSNQWEPSTKRQHASEVYEHRFGPDGHINDDIEKVLDRHERGEFLVPKTDLLVGGFPCQDYSVAKTLNSARGLKGKKGVLWWQILRLVQLNEPPLVLLENVDRLLKSPATRRGRDFAMMLRSLADEGYIVEWRVVNAAQYGFPQRRKRVFIVGKRLENFPHDSNWDALHHLSKSGVLARALRVEQPKISQTELDNATFEISGELEKISASFGKAGLPSPFRSSGVILGQTVTTLDLEPRSENRDTLGSILLPDEEVPEEFFIPKGQLATWRYLKGAKKEERLHAKSGTKYFYSEGSMAFPDLPENPSRTILTGEGGSTPSRFKHIIKTPSGRYRRLTPIELERLNGFPDDWTLEGKSGPISNAKRAFFMGNALVVGVVERIGKVLAFDLVQLSKVK